MLYELFAWEDATKGNVLFYFTVAVVLVFVVVIDDIILLRACVLSCERGTNIKS